ncbi:Bromodomain-containing protein [Lenzites betulinus]|nr:Bromodomain-containing protein [Lenzites betulinus]
MTDALSTTNLNAAHPDAPSAPDSPAVDSVATPVNNSLVSDIKIDVDFTEQESDARHEPVPPKAEKAEDASVVPQAGTPVDPGEFIYVFDASFFPHVSEDSIPIAPPHGTPPPPPGELLEDVKMAEENASQKGADVEMADASGQTNGLPNGQSSYANSVHANTDDNDDDKPPPAKRARKYSDAERASLANTATPPPASVSPPPATPLPPSSSPTLSAGQWRFCQSTVRTLKRMKDAGPFLNPVDPVALAIPHYPTIVKHPMDFSTIERKLTASNPTKPDPNAANPRYNTADEFIADIRLIFKNCVAFNGVEHPVTLMGKRVEAVFDKQIKQMPAPEEPKPPAPKKVATPPPPPPPAPPKKAARRPSAAAVPVIRRNDESAGASRPKREIHPPAPKDLPYAESTRKPRKAKAPRDAAVAEQLKYCEKIWKDLHQKQHYTIAHPFYEPVDPVKMGIPEYPKVVKKPMDLATMKKKLDAGEYATAEKFRDDFRLMIKNCMTFNPAGNPVHEAGKSLQQLFEEKWKNLPSPRAHDSDDEEDEEEEEFEDDRAPRQLQGMIADMETQIENMKNHLASLKRPMKEKKEKKEKKPRKPSPPAASTSKPTPKQTKAPPATKSKKTKKPVTDDDVLTFEQKKDLSDTISKLDGTKLERVIQIIHEGVPEIRDSTEEIELEIDQLPAAVLTKLYNFVIRPLRPPVKRPRTGKGTGTGGLKRKSMDEDVETKKIRALEERLKSFEQGGRASGGGANGGGGAEESEHSSAESSSDESSASDSE